MLSTLVLSLALAGTPRFAVTNFNCPGSPADRADFFTEHFAQRLEDEGLKVTSPRQIKTVLGIERQKELLGCAESCVAELAGALGVDAVVMGDVAKVGATFQVNLRVMSAADTSRVAGYSASAPSEEGALEALSTGAKDLAGQLSKKYGLTLVPTNASHVIERSKGSRRWWWVPLIGVAVGGALAGVGFSLAEQDRLVLANSSFLHLDTANGYYTDGVTWRAVGWVGAGVAAAAAVTSVALLLFGSEPEGVTPTVSLAPGGMSFGLTGGF